MQLRPAGSSEDELTKYSILFDRSFPDARHLRPPYLRWLYAANPAGPMVGFNAWEGDRLVAHYACVPTRARVLGRDCRALLSLNTATDPEFQGRGLFTKLADHTYLAAADARFDLVYGVANSNSTPGFVRKLGFQLVGPLESRVGLGGLGQIDWEMAGKRAAFRRDWSDPELAWRMSNPANPVRAQPMRDGSSGFSASSGKFGFKAWAQLGRPWLQPQSGPALSAIWPRVFVGAFPSGTWRPGFLRLPDSLRPAPLNFIVKGLQSSLALDANDLLFSFLDFDAF